MRAGQGPSWMLPCPGAVEGQLQLQLSLWDGLVEGQQGLRHQAALQLLCALTGAGQRQKKLQTMLPALLRLYRQSQGQVDLQAEPGLAAGSTAQHQHALRKHMQCDQPIRGCSDQSVLPRGSAAPAFCAADWQDFACSHRHMHGVTDTCMRCRLGSVKPLVRV